ncbi:MAG: ABC transporter substrate-binding protein [Alphaproteobacteria bacterium]
MATALVACAEEQLPVETADPVVIGAVYNTSGFQAVLDVPSLKGAQLAAAQLTEAGRQVTLVAVEGQSDAAALPALVGDAIMQNQDMTALIGLSDTDMVLAAAPVAIARDRVFVTSGATSPELPGQVKGGLFLACFGDNVQAAAAAEWAYGQKAARSALVLFDAEKTYTRLLQGYFVDRFRGLGGTISSVQSITEGSELPDPGDVDMIFLSVETAEDAAPWVQQIRAAGYAGPIVGGDGYDAASIWAAEPEIADVYFTTHAYLGADNPNPAVGEFIEAYAKANDGEAPGSFAALGYDAVGLVVAALEKGGIQDVAGGLQAISGYQGVTGSISFAGVGHIPTKGVTILKVSAGALEFVAEVVPRQVPAP